MTDDELVAWGRGYLDGWERSDENVDEREAPAAELSIGAIERGMWRKAWREIVLAGEDPTEDKIRERMWQLQTS